jgi:hypothetical protein
VRDADGNELAMVMIGSLRRHCNSVAAAAGHDRCVICCLGHCMERHVASSPAILSLLLPTAVAVLLHHACWCPVCTVHLVGCPQIVCALPRACGGLLSSGRLCGLCTCAVCGGRSHVWVECLHWRPLGCLWHCCSLGPRVPFSDHLPAAWLV